MQGIAEYSRIFLREKPISKAVKEETWGTCATKVAAKKQNMRNYIN
jgi:hypothetical protein